MRAIGYLRVSTEEQARSGLGLEAQREAIRTEAERRGWTISGEASDEGISGGTLERDGLELALDLLGAGEADVLMVAKLDRLSRSLMDFAALMERSRREGWAIVALDLGVDTATPAGEMLAGVMASFAQFERRMIGQRTREALAAKAAKGERLGRPVQLPENVRQRIADMRGAGMTLRAIADQLNGESVPTAEGGRWWPATIRQTLRSVALDREAAERREGAAA